MNRVTALLKTPAIVLERFTHEPGIAHRDPDQESARGHAVSFVEEGSFRLRVGGTWRRLSSTGLFTTTPGLEFSCAHDEDHPRDQCLSVRYTEAAIESLRSAGAGPLTTPVRRLTNRQAFLRLELLAGDARRRSHRSHRGRSTGPSRVPRPPGRCSGPASSPGTRPASGKRRRSSARTTPSRSPSRGWRVMWA